MRIRRNESSTNSTPRRGHLQDEGAPARIGVVYLSRAADGIVLLRRFLASYRTHPAGVDHDLIILFKGYEDAQMLAEGMEMMRGIDYEAVEIPDTGFDLDAYFSAAHSVDHEYLCFLNSFSRILADDWLAKLANFMVRSDVGLVGATGSFESPAAATALSWHETISHPVSRLRELARKLFLSFIFPGFPNPHMRTNAFMIARRDLLSLHHTRRRTKRDAYRFESGREGMTRQILDRGLEVLIVDRDGAAFEPSEWRRSNVFRCQNQDNLLIADNKTDTYDQADAAERQRLERLAWGDPHCRESRI